MTHPAAREVMDFVLHGASAFILLSLAAVLGVGWTPLGALLVAGALGFVREFTEWQDGGAPPWMLWGVFDVLGWITGGFVYSLLRL